MPLLCRVAENMFWMSRYVERAIAVSRLIDVTAHLELDAGDPERTRWTSGRRCSGRRCTMTSPTNGDAPLPGTTCATTWRSTRQPELAGVLRRRARAAARQVRDSISSEMWEQINTTYLMLSEPGAAARPGGGPARLLQAHARRLLLIQGLADATLAHDEAWQFLSLGKYLERADNVARLLRVQSHLLTTDGAESGDDTVRWLAVLRSAGSAEAYARYYSLRVEPTRVLEFLLLNPTFPQSVRFSLGAAWDALESIARATHDMRRRRRSRALGLLRARLEHASVDEVMEFGLAEFLTAIQDDIAQVSERITRAFFRYAPLAGATWPSPAPRRSWRAAAAMRIAVAHVTRLEFGDEVSETVMDAHLGPRDDADQRVERFRCAWSRWATCGGTRTASATRPTC